MTKNSLFRAASILGICAASAGALAAPDPGAPSTTLLCTFRAVQVGQFQGLRFINGPADGAISMTLVASAADRSAGRAVVIDDTRAAVMAMIVQPRQTVFVDSGTPNDATLISLFTNAQEGATIPASFSRQLILGAIAIVSQYTGSCTPQS